MTIMATKSRVIISNKENASSSADDDSEIELKTEESPNEEESEPEQESDDSADVNVDDGDDSLLNAGWADSIAKILKTNKPKGKKTLVLSKAKKLTDVHKTKSKDAGFEVQAQDGEIKREKIEVPEEDDKDKIEEPPRKKRKDLPTVRVKPNILNKDRERTLAKIATKGVVQLFNAVKKQQKVIDTKLQEAGPLEVKRDKVLKNIDKREFLNVLMGDKSRPANLTPQAEKVVEKAKSKESEGPTWSVLREDFMMGAKMKDWDKELEEESEVEQEREVVEESE